MKVLIDHKHQEINLGVSNKAVDKVLCALVKSEIGDACCIMDSQAIE